jgi:hypothetical protein
MNSHNALPLLLTCLFCSLASVRTKAQIHSGSGEAVTDLVKYEWNKKIGNDRIEPYYYMQDSRGLMWMATSLGPVSFDGYNFKRYDAEVYRLSASRTFRLAEDINGQIWIIGIRNSRIVVDVMNPGTEISQPLHQYLGLGAPWKYPCGKRLSCCTIYRETSGWEPPTRLSCMMAGGNRYTHRNPAESPWKSGCPLRREACGNSISRTLLSASKTAGEW